MTLLAADGTWFAVFGGLIPIIGFGAICWILWRAVQPPDDQQDDGGPDDQR